jgi:ABC-type transport system involved in multi-copper enzyme maturation permease subunit
LHFETALVRTSRRPSFLFGPLVWWELARLARRGHAARSRVLILYGLLLTMLGFAVVWSFDRFRDPTRLLLDGTGPLPTAKVAALSENLALVLLEAQLLLVAAVTPAFAASAISEEKDRETLPLLLTTDLTDREIVWGKAVGRALFVLLAILAGAPVLMLTLFLGGVDRSLLAAGYSLTAGTALLSAAIGVAAACNSPDSRTALVRAYGQSAIVIGGVLVPPFVLLSPFAMLIYTRFEFAEYGEVVRFACGFGYPIAQVTVAIAIVTAATRGLRKLGTTVGPIDRTAYPEPPRGRPAPIVFASVDAPLLPLPALDESDPVLWKERYCNRAPLTLGLDSPVRWLGGVFALVAVTLFITGGWLLLQRALLAFDPAAADRLTQRGTEPPDAGGGLMISAGVLAAGLYLLPLAVGVTGCVAGERHRATLDPLLTTSLDRRQTLRSKVRAHTESGLAFGVGSLTGIACGFGADGGARLGLAAMVAVAAGIALVVALAAWLSVRCATPARAFRLCLPAIVAAVGLPVLVRYRIDWERVAPSVAVFAWAAGICVVLAAGFWWRAGRELDRGD